MTTKTRAKATSADLSRMAEPELAVWASQTVAAQPDTPLVRFGALAFWTLVAGLLLARVLFVDPAKLRPDTSADAAPVQHKLIQLTSAPAN